MKNLKILLTPLIFLLVINSSQAQLFSDNFDGANCDENTCPCCIVNFVDAFSCLSQWSPSHGSPNTQQNGDPFWLEPSMGLNGLPLSGKAIAMLHGRTDICFDQGEGLFARDVSFEGGTCYEITFKLSKRVNSGNFRVKASNSLSIPSNIDQCCGTIPNVVSEDIAIIDFATINTGIYQSWAEISIFYSPTQDFDQFWIYPDYYDGSEEDPEDPIIGVLIDDVSIQRACTDNLIFSSPSVGIPSGYYYRGDFIIAGNAGGPGVINSDPSAPTLLEAGNYLKLTPNTRVTASGSNNFIMRCQPCVIDGEGCQDENNYTVSEEHIRIPDDDSNVFDDINPLGTNTGDNDFSKFEDFNIYPNPSNGIFNISVPAAAFSKNTQDLGVQIQIIDQLGKEVFTNIFYSDTITLSLDNLPKGVYLISMTINNQVRSKRLLIQ